jgi:hypothetical protein
MRRCELDRGDPRAHSCRRTSASPRSTGTATNRYGHVIVDRSGKGQVVDTGVPPVASPSGELLAAMDLSEVRFGALNAFAVWQDQAARVIWRQRGRGIPRRPTGGSTAGRDEACVNLSAVPWENSGKARMRHASDFARARTTAGASNRAAAPAS